VENFHGFHGILLTVNVLPLKFFHKYWQCPLTTQSMVPPGLKFSTAKVFPTYQALVMNCESFPLEWFDIYGKFHVNILSIQ